MHVYSKRCHLPVKNTPFLSLLHENHSYLGCFIKVFSSVRFFRCNMAVWLWDWWCLIAPLKDLTSCVNMLLTELSIDAWYCADSFFFQECRISNLCQEDQSNRLLLLIDTLRWIVTFRCFFGISSIQAQILNPLDMHATVLLNAKQSFISPK